VEQNQLLRKVEQNIFYILDVFVLYLDVFVLYLDVFVLYFGCFCFIFWMFLFYILDVFVLYFGCFAPLFLKVELVKFNHNLYNNYLK